MIKKKKTKKTYFNVTNLCGCANIEISNFVYIKTKHIDKQTNKQKYIQYNIA